MPIGQEAMIYNLRLLFVSDETLSYEKNDGAVLWVQ
jgi:hypothetical protein